MLALEEELIMDMGEELILKNIQVGDIYRNQREDAAWDALRPQYMPPQSSKADIDEIWLVDIHINKRPLISRKMLHTGNMSNNSLNSEGLPRCYLLPLILQRGRNILTRIHFFGE